MKKLSLLVMAVIAVMTTLMLQGCNGEANNQAAVQAAQEAAEASQQAAQASQMAAESLQSIVPRSITDRESGSTIGWGSLSPSEREEIIAIGKDHPYGRVIRPNPPIKEVTFILYLENVPSASSKQTLIEYTYETDYGEGTNRILVQGHFESVQSITSLPDVLNNNSCCIFYGGCIGEYECSTPLPKAEKCSPCEQKNPKKEECLPCQQQQRIPGPGKRQGDGAAQRESANGENKVLPPMDL